MSKSFNLYNITDASSSEQIIDKAKQVLDAGSNGVVLDGVNQAIAIIDKDSDGNTIVKSFEFASSAKLAQLEQRVDELEAKVQALEVKTQNLP